MVLVASGRLPAGAHVNVTGHKIEVARRPGSGVAKERSMAGISAHLPEGFVPHFHR